MKKLFGQIDKDGDGHISACEFIAAWPDKLSESEATEQIKKVDKDGDGKLDLEEFTSLVKTLNKKN